MLLLIELQLVVRLATLLLATLAVPCSGASMLLDIELLLASPLATSAEPGASMLLDIELLLASPLATSTEPSDEDFHAAAD
ncbi:hypothetical protein PR001_g33483 [Phytophthora rubi]|uniref:Uncharacterized protein n=1 Tax=Phytophthora rubi TaxID=129364 RepID=A0A6A3G0N3_9STRA|nr:hypothetical protein PR001_g33483 [Phytophthora rubi]